MQDARVLLTDPNLGLTSQAKFWAEIRKRGIKISRSQANEVFRNSNEQIGRPSVSPVIPIKCPFGTVGCLMIDLMDISRYASKNGNHKFLFNAIDIHSRHVWSVPVKNKRPATLLPHLTTVISDVRHEHPKSFISVSTDEGSEFKGSFGQYLKDEDIKHVTTLAKQNMAIIERFHRTLWQMFRNYINVTGKTDFLKSHPNLIHSYNTSKHSSLIDATPAEVYHGKSYPKSVLIPDITVPARPNANLGGYKVGDLVRVARTVGKFEKRSVTTRFSDDVYEIVSIKGNRFEVKNTKSGHVLKTMYLARELKRSLGNPVQPVQQIQDRITRVQRSQRVQAQEPEVPRQARPARQRREQVPSSRLLESLAHL